MNKQNRILLGVLAFVVACTIGYALFSETITINGTATAKGDWELTTTCTKGISGDLVTAGGFEIDTEAGYKSDTCTVSGNTVTASVGLEYPSAFRYFTIAVKNTGTITATLVVNDVASTLGVKTYKTSDNSLVTDTIPNSGNTIQWYAYEPMGFGKSDNTLVAAANWSDYYNETTGAITIKAGETVYFYEILKWPSDVNQNGVYYISNTTITLPFKQIEAQ